MVAIAATSSATPSLQSVLLKVRLEQAKREADQAESNAQDLQAQADIAESQAMQSRGKVRNLTNKAQQPDPTYQPQLQGQQSELSPKIQEALVSLHNSTRPNQSGSGIAIDTSLTPAPVLNSQGQSTGRIVNLSV
jgi:hypothetical protein